MSHQFKDQDPLSAIAKAEQATKEAWIDIEKTKQLRKNVSECYRREGVNHYENCKAEVQAYYEALQSYKTGNKMI